MRQTHRAGRARLKRRRRRRPKRLRRLSWWRRGWRCGLLELQVLLLLLAHPRLHICKVLEQTCPGGLCLRQLRMERGILRLSLRLALLGLAQALLHTPLVSPSLRLEALVAHAT